MTKVRIVRGTTNVLADLGFPDAEEIAAKVFLAIQINKAVDARKLKQSAAGKVLGLPQSKVSLIRNYKIDGFSLEKLMGLLNALNRDIEIVVRSKPAVRRRGRITLKAA
ncbi:MAG: helix-turn-helix transcriptional regulator [Rhodospirillaceae bacterium]|nr:helix-turn-helix transcriptional regulator [Rhodospirillaceae bacterium]